MDSLATRMDTLLGGEVRSQGFPVAPAKYCAGQCAQFLSNQNLNFKNMNISANNYFLTNGIIMLRTYTKPAQIVIFKKTSFKSAVVLFNCIYHQKLEHD